MLMSQSECQHVRPKCILFISFTNTQKMKFSIKDLFTKCDQIGRTLQIWSHLLKKSLMENFNFCAVKRKMPARFLKSCIFAKTEPSISREITIKNFHSAFQNISCNSCDIEVTCITAQKMKLCFIKV